MNSRKDLILSAYTRFEGVLRLRRWQAIDEALEGWGQPPLSSTERDEIDLAAATGMPPYAGGDTPCDA